MAWFKVDDSFHSSRKVLSIPARLRIPAIGLWTIAGSWSAAEGTDGSIPDYMLKVWGATEKQAQALVDAGLWERTCGSYVFHMWLKYQPSKAQVEAKRDASKERMRSIRASRKEREPQEQADSSVLFARTDENSEKPVRDSRPVPSRPDPELSNDSSVDRRSTQRNHPLPADWEPTPEHQERSFEYGLDLGKEIIKFKAHAEEKARLAKNWNAAFTRWLVNAHEYQHKNTPHGDRPYTSDRQGQLLKAEGERIARQYGTLEIDS